MVQTVLQTLYALKQVKQYALVHYHKALVHNPIRLCYCPRLWCLYQAVHWHIRSSGPRRKALDLTNIIVFLGYGPSDQSWISRPNIFSEKPVPAPVLAISLSKRAVPHRPSLAQDAVGNLELKVLNFGLISDRGC